MISALLGLLLALNPGPVECPVVPDQLPCDVPNPGVPGCSDPACCAAVCAELPFCCKPDPGWDAVCARQAALLCAPSGPCPGGGDCCASNGTPGCDDELCCQLVCTVDEYCCDYQWDAVCVSTAAELCANLGCVPPVCGNPAAGDCCAGHGDSGCDDEACCAAVCELDPACCLTGWDDPCATLAGTLCEFCPPPPPACGDPGAGDCCSPHDGAACNDAACCAAVCEVRPQCCSDAWGVLCVATAEEVCGATCPVETGCPWDLDGDGIVGTVDFLGVLAAWGPNPGDPADFDGDGTVGTVDFLDLLGHWGTCAVEQCDVNLTIHKGQSGSALAEDEEVTRGAFTVANLNDTDCDGVVDNADGSVKKADGEGRNEVDLMLLEVDADGPDDETVVLELVAGEAKVWAQETKEVAIDLPRTWRISELPVEVWVEATAVSDMLRSIQLKLSCTSSDSEDVVTATGIWAEVETVAHDRTTWREIQQDPDWAMLTDPPGDEVEDFDGTGVLPSTSDGLRNGILIRWRVLPEGISGEDRPKFDGTRRKEGRTWSRNGTQDCVLEQSAGFPEACEDPNDDRETLDESRDPTTTDEYFCWDIPGAPDPDAHADLLIRRLNFRDFMRVQFSTFRPKGNRVSGSRCSDYYDWHARLRLVKNADGDWVRSGGEPPESGDNDVGPDHEPLGTCP